MIDSLDMRDLHVLVAHPHDRDADVIVRQLHRIGAQVTVEWPAPPEPPAPLDIAVYPVGAGSSVPSWLVQTAVALIAVCDGDAPSLLRNLSDGWPHAVLVRPVQPAAVLTSLVLAHRLHRYETRLQAKVAKLEDALRSVRKVEKAKAILMRDRHCDERAAYEYLRTQAMNKRVPIQLIATTIIDASEMLS